MGEEVSPKKGPRNFQREEGTHLRTSRFLTYVTEKNFSTCQTETEVYLGKQIHIQGRMGAVSRERGFGG